MDMDYYANYTLEEIKDACRMAGIRCAGKRETLIRKLNEHEEQARIQNARFKVNIRTIMGFHYTVYCAPDTPFDEFKGLAAEKTGWPVEKLSLWLIRHDTCYDTGETTATLHKITGGTLAENNVHNDAYMQAHLSLR